MALLQSLWSGNHPGGRSGAVCRLLTADDFIVRAKIHYGVARRFADYSAIACIGHAEQTPVQDNLGQIRIRGKPCDVV